MNLVKYLPKLKIPIIRVNTGEMDKFTGYVTGNIGNVDQQPDQTGTVTPDKNGYVWTLPNGQAFPPTRIILFSNNKRTYYYEDKNLTTKFQVIGKTIEECSREAGVQVGEFTGLYQFNDTDPFGKGYTLRSLQVKTKFPFDRLGAAVETEYTLWVDTFVKYNVDNGQTGYDDKEPGSTGNTGGYTTGTGSNTDKATKNRNAILIIGGLLLLALTQRKRK